MRAVAVSLVMIAGCSSGRRSTPPEPGVVRWHAPVDIAYGGGTRGEWRQNKSDYDYVDDTTVALADDGATIVAWVDQRAKDILVQRHDGDGGRSAPFNLSRSPDVFSWLPRIAVAGDDILVLWQEIVFSGGSHGGDALLARSRDGGRTFEAPRNLSRSRNGDGKGQITREVWHNGSLDLAASDDGTVVAAWTEFDGPLWLVTSRDGGALFSSPQRLDDGAGAARAPAIAIAGDRVLVAWTVGTDERADLRMRVSSDAGATFGPARVVTATPGFSDAPKLAVDGTGVVHLAWAESRGGPFDAFTVRYARSRDGGASFEDARELSRCAAPASCAFPMLAVDDQRVVVSWELATSPRDAGRGLALTASRDGGDTFSKSAFVPASVDPAGGTNGSHQGKLMEKLAVRGDTIAVAMSALAHGRGSRTWFVQGTFADGQRVGRATSRQRQQLTR